MEKINIIAQVFGAIALCLLAYSYQTSDKKKFLFINIFTNIFYAIQYVLLNAVSAFVSNIITIIKTICFYTYEKKEIKIPIWFLIIFEILVCITGVLTYEGLYSLIPLFINFIYTIGEWQKNMKVMYAIGVFVAILWIYYDFIVGAYVAVIASVIELIASSVGLFKLFKGKKKIKLS